MATLDVKFTKFDNRPWGFRLAGGSDFEEPLTVIRVAEESLAECMGLKVGDVVVKLNDRDISDLTHGQAHEALMLAGNNFVVGVRRKEDLNAVLDGIDEKIEPYMLPIENILYDQAEDKEQTPEVEEKPEESEADNKAEIEVYPEKPRDENSDPLPNKNLTDEEIAQLILDEEEVLNDKGVLGVNFKKLRPRAALLKESKVFQELQQEANADPRTLHEEELNRYTTFLKRPERPVPKARPNSEEGKAVEAEVEPYKVVIKKQPKKTVTERLLQKGLIAPSRLSKTPEPSEPTAAESAAAEVNESPTRTLESSSITDSSTIRFDEIDLVEKIEADAMTPINESSFEQEPAPITIYNTPPTPTALVPSSPTAAPTTKSYNDYVSSPSAAQLRYYDEQVVAPSRVKFVPEKAKKMKLRGRGRYVNRCFDEALESIKSRSTKPTLLKRAHYFERIVGDLKKSLNGDKDDSLLRVILLTTLAYSLRDTYDAEILHRGSSRRNSRRLSCAASRRESLNGANSLCATYEDGYLVFRGRKNSECLASFQSTCAEGRRRLSVMGMVVADKLNHAMHTDLARGLAYAMVPCASALAFFMFNYAKRFNDTQ